MTVQADRRARAARRWQVTALVLGLVTVAFAVWAGARDALVPDSSFGWGFGIAAAALLLVAALYGARRRVPRLASRARLGRAYQWVQVHLWGGGLFLLLVLLHTGFHRPTGPLTSWLFWLSLWVVLTGVLGRVLERWLPSLMASALSVEVLYERIPELVADIERQAEELVSRCSDPIRSLYRRDLAPALAAPRPRASYFFDITGGVRARLRDFEFLGQRLDREERGKLDELQRLYETKLQIDAHFALQRALRWWLWTHVPPSIVLLALVGVHVWTVLTY